MAGDVCGQVDAGCGGSEGVAAAVEVQHRSRRLAATRRHRDGADAAELDGYGADVLGDGVGADHLVEDGAHLVRVAAHVERGAAQQVDDRAELGLSHDDLAFSTGS
ncbi:hypothetical protein [Sphaerimonospora thailandensis]|uniref:Uncharacterized protein n=1 Tax=Sphaerimonospora thailandensis TaxID=795644 RepID=A0A8J3REE9_9ACTN|nr:hypothetical protein [Sphaerimonospora thailandensis]GIH70918.1 hypothetical protein Mth01_31710 [Sphaerimonospora thailandensis]